MTGAMFGVLAKAAVHCEEHKIEPAVLLGCRLYLDMFALTRQVQVAADSAKGGCARLADVPAPNFENTEATFAELQTRLDRTAEFIRTLTPEQIDGSEEHEINIRIAGRNMHFVGQPYLLHFVLPDVYFHATGAYAIVRHNGVAIGKRDFTGTTPGMA